MINFFILVQLCYIQKGLVIPISLLCKNPKVVPNTVCKIIVSKATSPAALPSNRLMSESSVNESLEVEDSQEDVSEDEAAESVIREIAKFLDVCKQKNILQTSQYRLLVQLLAENACVITHDISCMCFPESICFNHDHHGAL